MQYEICPHCGKPKKPPKPLKVITSPPYGEAMASEKCGIDFSKSKPDYPGRQMHEGRIKQHKDRSDNMNYGEDADNIGNLPDRPLKSVMSPPYANEAKGLSQEEYDKKQVIINEGRKKRGDIKGGIGRSGALGTSILNPDGYGSAAGQIGSLPDKPLKTVTSPPYEDMRAREYTMPSVGKAWKEGKRGYQDNSSYLYHKQDNETYLSAMLTVYQQISLVSDVLCIVIKNPTRAGQLRRLDLDTIKLLEISGWKLYCQHRALLFEELEQGDMFTGSQKKVKGRMSFFKRLSWQNGQPVASWEDILVAVRE